MSFDLTMLYLRLIFAGIPIIAAYNIFAAILRALGNSRSPLIAMTVAAVINVGLDLLFVAVFGWGVAGAAVATVLHRDFQPCTVCLYYGKSGISDWKRRIFTGSRL